MLRLYDPRTGTAGEVRPAHGRELRVLAVPPAGGAAPRPAQWRAWLVPDLISRSAERRGLVATVCEITAPGEGAPDGQEAAREALNIHPPTRTAPASEPVERTVEFVTAGRPGQAAEGPPFDIGTGEPGWLSVRRLARLIMASPGAVTMDGPPAAADDGGAPSLDQIAARGLDPLVVRLALLGHRYREEADLSWEALFTAGTALLRWRERVAQWAYSPSAPMPRRYADAISDAFDDDLDTPRALRELEALEADPGVPDGAKFEAFAAMDRLFGLDLARDIGK